MMPMLLKWRAVACLAVLTIAASASAAQRASKPAGPAPPPADRTQPAASPPSDDLTVVAWLDLDQLEEGAVTRLRIAIRNPHQTQLRKVTGIHIQIPGFRQVGSCWAKQAPACLPSEKSPSEASATPPPWDVPAGSTVFLSAEVARTTRGAGTFFLSGSYDWTNQDSPRRGAIEPVKVSVLGGRPFDIPREWLEFLKDLILPLTLVGVAWALQRYQQARSERQVVWTNMLAKVHQNAEKYYLPASMAMETLRVRLNALRPWQGRPAADFEPAVLPFLLVLRRMRLLVTKIGGFYFKDRRGERVVARSWELFFRCTRAEIDNQALDFLLDRIGPFESVAEFAVKKQDSTFNAAYIVVRDGLAAWASTSLFLSACSLELCAEVFDTETNRAFEMWYGETEPIPRERISDLMNLMETNAGLAGPTHAETYKRLQAALNDYLAQNREG
jgi:hypothetical protein